MDSTSTFQICPAVRLIHSRPRPDLFSCRRFGRSLGLFERDALRIAASETVRRLPDRLCRSRRTRFEIEVEMRGCCDLASGVFRRVERCPCRGRRSGCAALRRGNGRPHLQQGSQFQILATTLPGNASTCPGCHTRSCRTAGDPRLRYSHENSPPHSRKSW